MRYATRSERRLRSAMGQVYFVYVRVSIDKRCVLQTYVHKHTHKHTLTHTQAHSCTQTRIRTKAQVWLHEKTKTCSVVAIF